METSMTNYDLTHSPLEIRAAVIRKIEDLAEKFPMIRLGEMLDNAVAGNMYTIQDDQLLRALDQLWITYNQFTAARIL